MSKIMAPQLEHCYFFIDPLGPFYASPIVGFLKPTIDTYTQKSILCAPICAIFESSTFKSTENSRVDLIIGATIRSTR